MSFTFFTDRNLGKQFPGILREAGFVVERHGDHFRDDVPDEEWIAEVARRDWVGITHDRAIRRRPNEKAAVLEACLRLIVVVGKRPFPEIATHFARARMPIERFISRNAGPWIAGFYVPSPRDLLQRRDPAGRIEKWLPK